ncbi:MAG: helix-turn-helix transcriptional regulator [Bacteroidota bacterium]
MKSDFFVLHIATVSGVVLICLFSFIYLASVNWRKNKWLLIVYFPHLWACLAQLVSGEGYDLIPENSFLLNSGSLLLVHPALYCYIYDLVKPNRIQFRELILHFLPGTASYILIIIIGWEEPAATITRDANSLFMNVFLGFSLVLISFYSYAMLRLVRLNQDKYQDKYASNAPNITLKWLNGIIYFLFFIPFLGLSAREWWAYSLPEGELVPVAFSMIIAVSALSYYTFRQPILYQEERLEAMQQEAKKAALKHTKAEKPEPEPKEKGGTTADIGLSEEEKATSIHKIEAYFEESKPYLNPKIRMPDLARALNIPRHIFSFLINEHYQMNFFNLINKYRIEYAKGLLQDQENQYYTFETIGEMAGFNSTSTFYRQFKEFTGMSPKAFQQKEKA